MRFPEFDGEWKKSRLNRFASKITKKNKGNTISNVLSNSANYGIIPQADFFDRSIANSDNTEGYYIIEKNDFVYNPRKSASAPYGPINIYNGEVCGIISPLYLCFKVKGINRRFLYHYFKSTKWHPYMYANGDSGARHDRVSIKDETFLELPLFHPDEEEQCKIVELVESIDERIATQIKIIEDLKKLKSAICKILFEHCDRVSNIRLLGDICKITTGKLDANAMTDDGKYPFFTCAREDYKTDTFAFYGDSLLISGNGEIGIVKRYNGKFNAYQRTYVLQNFSENIEYLMYYIEYHLPKRVLKEKNVGAMPYIVLSTLSEMPIKMPDIKKQFEVNRTLTCLSELIELNSKLKDSYTSQKSYLLAQMFI